MPTEPTEPIVPIMSFTQEQIAIEAFKIWKDKGSPLQDLDDMQEDWTLAQETLVNALPE